MRLPPSSLAGLSMLALLYGCHQSQVPPVATSQDVAAAEQQAQRAIAEARAEASKDVKSAAKVSGHDSAVVTEAKVTGQYDVAMVKADGEHTIASEKCLTLQPAMQKGCQDQADADYDAAKSAAKAIRLAKRQ